MSGPWFVPIMTEFLALWRICNGAKVGGGKRRVRRGRIA